VTVPVGVPPPVIVDATVAVNVVAVNCCEDAGLILRSVEVVAVMTVTLTAFDVLLA
jgi:hypothetical protein